MVPAETHVVLGHPFYAVMGVWVGLVRSGVVVLLQFNENWMVELILAFEIVCL